MVKIIFIDIFDRPWGGWYQKQYIAYIRLKFENNNIMLYQTWTISNTPFENYRWQLPFIEVDGLNPTLDKVQFL